MTASTEKSAFRLWSGPENYVKTTWDDEGVSIC